MNIREIIKEVFNEVFNEKLITERLTDIDSDVDFIYDKVFKEDVDDIQAFGVITNNMFKNDLIMKTSDLTSNDSIKANQLNPCTIIFNNGLNYYKPMANEISISINLNAANLIKKEGGKIDDVDNYLSDDQARRIKFEFSEAKIKGSIHHELVHWIDDTLNNRHISKKLSKANEFGGEKIFNGPVNASKMEIQSQIHNIKQLHNKYKNTWDYLTFDDMVSYSPPLHNIMNTLPSDIRKQWVKSIKTRMYREGLLGKMMIFDK